MMVGIRKDSNKLVTPGKVQGELAVVPREHAPNLKPTPPEYKEEKNQTFCCGSLQRRISENSRNPLWFVPFYL
jgi:hypothetical protein